jgi:WD40 repeat protein
MRVLRSCVLGLILAAGLTAGAQELYSRRTEQLNLIYYDKAHEYLTYHLTRSFENSLAFHRKLFDYTPSEPIVILMQDFGDYGHGGTSTVPWNYISIGIEPFDYVYETMPANERMNWLMHHELVHVVATDKGANEDLRFRRFFRGKVAPNQENPMSMFYSYLTSPRWYSPRWYHEGIAVFLETWMAGGVGRVLGGYDEMVFRTKELEHGYFFDIVGLESEGTAIDFQVGQNSYLYGTRFLSWLAVEHGPEKLIQWFNRTSDSRRYFSTQFQHVYGVSLEHEWRRWIAAEKVWQEANLERIRQYPVTPQKKVTDEVIGSVSRSFYDPDRKLVYAAINRPGKPASIASIDVTTGKITPLAEVISPALYFVTSMAYDPHGRKIFYTSANSKGWRTIQELDLQSGKRRPLLQNARTGDLVVNPADQSIWGMQHHNGLSTLVRIPPPYDKWESLLTVDYGRDIFDLDISPDGKSLSASMIEVTGEQKLILLDTQALRDGKGSFDVLHVFENNSPANFVFSRDGRYLYGTSYYTGVSNVWRYDLANRKMEAGSNVESGVFRPIPIDDRTLLAWKYESTGFSPVLMPIETREDLNAINYLGQQIVEKWPIVKSWTAGSPARVDLDKVTTYAGPYKPLSQFRLGSVYPVLEGYKDQVTGGVRLNFSDPLALHTLDLTAAVTAGDTPNDERFHLKARYDHAPWKLTLKYNATDFYDLFGPTKTSRKGHSAGASYHQYLVYEKPKTLEYTLSGAFYGGLDTLPDYQNISAPFDKYATIGGHLDYENLRKTIGAVDFEKGQAWSLGTTGNYVNDEFFPRVEGSYDFGFLLPHPHTAMWIRTSAGKSWGDRDNAFSNFFFGGFGNNWVDYREVRRYRDSSSFPGVEIDELGGTEYAQTKVEVTLPPIRFEKLGVPGLYTNWLRTALFAGALVTDPTSSDLRRNNYDAGIQFDLSIVAFSNLDSIISVGYARAFPEDGDASDEVMVSLRLLK